MPDKANILITGVSGFPGNRVAERLLELPGYNVIGLDVEKPAEELKGLDFIQADIRNPLMVELLKTENIDTVCHLGFLESDRPNEMAFDFNVMGTTKLFSACAEAGVRRIVIKSSTWVYGANPQNSAFLNEDKPLRGSRSSGTVRDLLEIESFCNGFRQDSPEVALTVLRFAPMIGPGVDTPMTRFLIDSYAPLLLGFDPRMQVIHEDDVTGAIVHALLTASSGTFNVASAGVMPITRMTGFVGKPLLMAPYFCLYLKSRWFSNLMTFTHWPIEPDYLRYHCVADTRKMDAELQFIPRYTAEEALREFAGIRRMNEYSPKSSSLSHDEDRLRDTLERRRRDRQRDVDNPITATEGGSHG